ncbi:MAG: hypothetical protein Q9220_000926 [cf. Caloplaca sp. 1 TL-2023]
MLAVLMLHGGGLTIGSKAFIPPSQISYLASLGFVVVVPNYRLCPQVTALDGPFADTLSVFNWCKKDLPRLLGKGHNVAVDASRVAVMGHSAGGTLSLWLGTRPDPPRAIAAFYPSLYVSDPSTTMHQPCSAFANFPDYQDTPDNRNSLLNLPGGGQLSTFPPLVPGQPPKPRHMWLFSQLKHGLWPSATQPDGDFKAIDPCTHFATKAETWPPTMFVQGDKDDVPGSGLSYVERAINDLKQGGARTVKMQVVKDGLHMFDMQPDAAVGCAGQKAEAVQSALDFLAEHVELAVSNSHLQSLVSTCFISFSFVEASFIPWSGRTLAEIGSTFS